MTAVLAIPDAELLQRASAGERDSLEELFVRHRSLAYRVAYRLLGHEQDALDAVQEAFVKALTHLPTFEGRSSFKTWLLRVVSNAALDLGRQRGRRETMSMDALGQRRREEMEPSVWVEPDREMQREDLRRELQQALDGLPPAQRQTFVLHVDAELSYREVADSLGISIGTVMSRLFYARQKLRAILASWTRR
ncbi:MAG: RNA polymerase sigma factor [Gemmataceae bacterium]|nr:RNA polymerase sigma factor [Gemmataceae bacterium]